MSNEDIDTTPDDLDAEGHSVRGKGVDDGSGDDADGQMVRGKGLDDASDDDAEGHAQPKIPGKPNRRA